MGEVIVTTCQYVLGTLGLTDNLSITDDVHHGFRRRAVEDSQHDIVMPAAGNDIDAVIGNELCRSSAREGLSLWN